MFSFDEFGDNRCVDETDFDATMMISDVVEKLVPIASNDVPWTCPAECARHASRGEMMRSFHPMVVQVRLNVLLPFTFSVKMP